MGSVGAVAAGTGMFAFVIGLWRLRRWGLWLAIFYYAFTLLWTLPDIRGAG